MFIRRYKLFKPLNTFQETCVDFFTAKYDVISQLRHSYAKGPFCVAQLILLTILNIYATHAERWVGLNEDFICSNIILVIL